MGFLAKARPQLRNATSSSISLTELSDVMQPMTMAGEPVTPERSKSVATAYRAGNIISDDVAKMPFQQFVRIGRTIQQVAPDPRTMNLPPLSLRVLSIPLVTSPQTNIQAHPQQHRRKRNAFMLFHELP